MWIPTPFRLPVNNLYSGSSQGKKIYSLEKVTWFLAETLWQKLSYYALRVQHWKNTRGACDSRSRAGYCGSKTRDSEAELVEGRGLLRGPLKLPLTVTGKLSQRLSKNQKLPTTKSIITVCWVSHSVAKGNCLKLSMFLRWPKRGGQDCRKQDKFRSVYLCFGFHFHKL